MKDAYALGGVIFVCSFVICWGLEIVCKQITTRLDVLIEKLDEIKSEQDRCDQG